MMILYIHGFSGHGFGTKAQLVQTYFAKNNVVTPSLPYIPTLAIDTIKQQINFAFQYEDVFLIGSSLGGYYATYLADYFKIKAVLLNPVVDPSLLSRYIGEKQYFYDNSSYEWNKNHIKMLKQYTIETIDPSLYFLLTQTGDEVLNYKQGVEKFSNAQKIITQGGNHSFENFENYVPSIKKFFAL